MRSVVVDNERIRHLFWRGIGPKPSDGLGSLHISAAGLKEVLGLGDHERVVAVGGNSDEEFLNDQCRIDIE